MTRLLLVLFGTAVVAVSTVGCRDEQQFPNRPITLLCPWSPGGGTDLVSREIGALLEEELTTPVNVINATGGSGVTGHTRGALAKPDGYTLTMITVELNMLHWRGLTSISYEDFDPLILVNRDAAAIFVRAAAPWQTLADLQQAIRARPHEIKASGTAQGGIWHVAVAGWLDAVGMQADDAIWISINGAGPSLQELLSGGIDFICCSLPEADTLMESGDIRALGVMAPARVDGYPDVPTFGEQGVEWSMGGWRGLALPKGVPEDRRQVLLDGLNRVLARDDYREFMRTNGFDARGDGPAEFTAALARHDQEFGEILTSDAYQSVRQSRYGPMVFPGAVAASLVAIAALLGLNRRRESAAPLADEQPTDRSLAPDSGSKASAWIAIGLTVVWVIGFIALMDWLGFVLTSIVFVTVLMRYLGTRLYVAAVISAIVAVVAYQLFAIQLRVSLPPGLWGW